MEDLEESTSLISVSKDSGTFLRSLTSLFLRNKMNYGELRCKGLFLLLSGALKQSHILQCALQR